MKKELEKITIEEAKRLVKIDKAKFNNFAGDKDYFLFYKGIIYFMQKDKKYYTRRIE